MRRSLAHMADTNADEPPCLPFPFDHNACCVHSNDEA